MTLVAPYADPIDAFRFGEYRRPAAAAPRFTGRLVAEPGRYHVYGAWTDPASHRLAIIRALGRLEDVVSMSYLDGRRDGRGWAFREATGPDPVNGFTLLREAYDASVPVYTGDVSVPVVWDRRAGTIVSNDALTVGLDLATVFGTAPALYPRALRAEIDRAGAWAAAEIGSAVGSAVYSPVVADAVVAELQRLDRRLAMQPYLVGSALTDADIRLWVTLVRYDAGPNAHGVIGPHLDRYCNLWRWARRLYAEPAFRDTTDFTAFTAPFADRPDWN